MTWEENDSMVMSWIMNSIQPQIASTITYYTIAKEMWEFLRQTYSQDKNVSKILQAKEELHNLRQRNQDLSQYFATVKATNEQLKFLRPPCKSCYKSHFEPTMIAKFLAGLSPEYAAAKDQMLTGSEIPDLSDAYNRLSHPAISLSQPAGVTPASALVVGGGRGQGTTYSARGRGIGRGTGGRGRFQCTYCEKMGHLEDRCWDKHGRPSTMSQGRGMVTKQGKSLNHPPMGSAQVATSTVDGPSSSTVSKTVTDLQTRKTIGGGYEKGGVYILPAPVGLAATSPTSPAPVGLAATSPTSESTFFQWHLRLGHPSGPKLRSIPPNLSIPESFQCEACQLGKHTHSSFPSSLSPSSQGLFDLLHIDVWGPSRVASRAKFRWEQLREWVKCLGRFNFPSSPLASSGGDGLISCEVNSSSEAETASNGRGVLWRCKVNSSTKAWNGLEQSKGRDAILCEAKGTRFVENLGGIDLGDLDSPGLGKENLGAPSLDNEDPDSPSPEEEYLGSFGLDDGGLGMVRRTHWAQAHCTDRVGEAQADLGEVGPLAQIGFRFFCLS
ncbi:hypothetical protein EJ110_NYTH50401 [Nymphaea thermarum]|nr:hypothetical protein EJ110_NYTH50401 [Nymphaea thermarum]